MVRPFQRRTARFLAVLGRTSGLLISAPYFQSQTIPVTLRAGIALLLALVLSPVLGLQPGPWLQGNLWVLTVLGEVLTGLAMGYIMNLLFAAVQLGGQLIEVPMGFGMVNILDPQTGGEMPIIGQLHQLLTTWLFLFVSRRSFDHSRLGQKLRIAAAGRFYCDSAGRQRHCPRFLRDVLVGGSDRLTNHGCHLPGGCGIGDHFPTYPPSSMCFSPVSPSKLPWGSYC